MSVMKLYVKHYAIETILYLLLVMLPFSVWGQDATVVEATTTMGTYPFFDPDPVANPEHLYYPYFRYDGFSTEKVDKEWKIIEMENPYIKVTLFPEIGGKVWGAIDKTTGKAFLYYNHVVKFRDIAMRGAWVSGGIEFNFGIIGHVPTSATPIDYMTRKKSDGSVSVYVSSYELMTRTFWTVEVNLPKDKAYFTTHTTWYNASSLDQPYYHWMNAAYKASDEMEFVYPGDHYIGHSGDLHAFPMDQKGRDLSWYKENAFGASKSYHVIGTYSDFYGTYWHDTDFGSVHYCPYDEKLGKKIFLWSQSREGMIWEDLLTDADGQYVELQSGKMYNQPSTESARTPFKHAFFRPEATDVWTEYWYPVKGTKGIVKGSPIGALNVERDERGTTLYFSPVQDMQAQVKVEAEGKTVFSEQVDFKTLEPWTHTIDGGLLSVDCKIKVTIGDADLYYSEEQEDNVLNRPKEIPDDFDWNSVYGLYTSGEQWFYQKYFTYAEKDLKAALDKDKYFFPALVRLSSLYYRWGRYDSALELLRTALSLNAYDGEANYLYALCNLRLGAYTDAKDGFSVASYDPAMRSAAYAGLAGLFIRERNWRKAISFAEKSLSSNPKNLHALQELMVCYRNLGQKEKAQELQDGVLEDLPLAQGVRYERYLLDPSDKAREEFASLIRNELPNETYMELAVWYESMGCLDEAIDLLSFAADDPVSFYKKAWLSHQLGKEEEADALIEAADELSVELAFPFRAENLPAMEWAVTKTDSWKPVYLQALLYHANGDKVKALELLRTCGETGYNPFYLYRASLESGTQCLEDLKKAESLEKSWRTGMALIQYYESRQDHKQANETAARYYKLYPKNYALGLQYGTTLCEVGEYRKSISILKKVQVLPMEGSYSGRAIYRKANLYEAIDFLVKGNQKKALRCIEDSKLWPENLGVGKPYEDQIDYRFENYLEAQVIRQTEPDQASSLLQKVAVLPNSKRFDSACLLVAMAMRQLDQTKEADEWVDNWSKEYGDTVIVRWCTAIYKGDKELAKSLLADRTSQSESTPWENVYIDRNFDLVVHLFQ